MSAVACPEPFCPLCLEPLDETERSLQYCPCGYSLCLFCWNKLMESDSGLCPNCRKPYDSSTVVAVSSNKPTDEGSSMEDIPNKKNKKKKGGAKKGIKLSGQERRNLQELRILQKNLVYAVGLSLDICIESVLQQEEFFGQFGPLKKISVNRSSPYSSGQSRNGPTGAAYVTFVNDDDATRCVTSIDGAVWDGHYIRACFGTTKYCQAFLKGAQCNNPDCLYMHYLVTEGTFTKEEMNAGCTKGRPEIYNLINFDRTKGPVPGSLAKPPKGPGAAVVRKETQIRCNSSLDLDGTRGRLVQEQDWPLLSQKQRGPQEMLRAGRLSLDIDGSSVLTRGSVEGSWTGTALKSTASGTPLIAPPLQTQVANKKKTMAVLSSPGKVKMVTTRPSRGNISSPREPPFGHSIAEETLIPKLSTESSRSHLPFCSEELQDGATSGPYVPPHAKSEILLRGTKSATPIDDDLSRDNNYSSIEAMIRRRTSVPEPVIDEATVGLSTGGGRRGPPPGFNSLKTRASAHAVLDRSMASEQALRTRLSYELAADEFKRQALSSNYFDQLAQNMLPAQPPPDLSANLFAGGHNQPDRSGMQNAAFVSNLESPFVGPGGQHNIGQPNTGFPLGHNSDMQNELFQSLISDSSGLGVYALQQKNSTQLSGRGSIPTMQSRLSADAIDGSAVFDTLQKSQLSAVEGNQALTAFLNRQDIGSIPAPPPHQTTKVGGDGAALDRQSLPFGQNLTSQITPGPFNDPAVLAFKKPGQQEIYPMGLSAHPSSNALMPTRESTSGIDTLYVHGECEQIESACGVCLAMPATPFGDANCGVDSMWPGSMNVPMTPFLATSQPAEIGAPQWGNTSVGGQGMIGGGDNVGRYSRPVNDQTLDTTTGIFLPDKVSSTQT